MVREARYDETGDSQADFRILMDSMARPGQLRRLDSSRIQPPEGLYAASALTAFCLMDSEVSCHCAGFAPVVEEYLRANTNSRAVGVMDADFVFLANSTLLNELAVAKTGDPEYPELAATVLIQVSRLEESWFEGSLAITTSGPGVDGSRQFYVSGMETAFLTLLRNINEDFPLGLDVILTSGNTMVSLPRSQRLEWEVR